MDAFTRGETLRLTANWQTSAAAAAIRGPWAVLRTEPVLTVCWTWPATYGSGCWIGMIRLITRIRRLKIRPGRPPGHPECCGAVPGTMYRGLSERLTVAGSNPATVTVTSASGVSARFLTCLDCVLKNAANGLAHGLRGLVSSPVRVICVHPLTASHCRTCLLAPGWYIPRRPARVARRSGSSQAGRPYHRRGRKCRGEPPRPSGPSEFKERLAPARLEQQTPASRSCLAPLSSNLERGRG